MAPLARNRLAALGFRKALVKLGPLLGRHAAVEGSAARGFGELSDERALVARRQGLEQLDNCGLRLWSYTGIVAPRI